MPLEALTLPLPEGEGRRKPSSLRSIRVKSRICWNRWNAWPFIPPRRSPMTRIQIVGLGMAALDFLVRTRELPNWEQGANLSGMGLEGGGPVATALVAAQRLG